jgi:putative membrane protein
MKPVLFAAGLGLCAVIWTGPLLDVYARSFTAHMLAHMGVVAVAAPLLALGIAGTRWDPTVRHPLLFAAVPASLVELVAVWAWHMPALRGWVEASAIGTAIEQASFLAAGLLLWLACLGHDARGQARQGAVGAFALLLTSVHMTLLGALLALTPRPLYGIGEVTCLGLELTAEQDQQAGGVIMLLVGAAAYLAGGLALLGRVLGEPASSRPGGAAR